MKIIRKDQMPNGVKIQLEDWSEEYPNLFGLHIGAYPVAKNSGKYGFTVSGDRFRLTIATNKYSGYNDEDVLADYESLISGQKALEDLAPHFWNGDEDKWYLGMFKPDTDDWYEAANRYGINAGMYHT